MPALRLGMDNVLANRGRDCAATLPPAMAPRLPDQAAQSLMRGTAIAELRARPRLVVVRVEIAVAVVTQQREHGTGFAALAHLAREPQHRDEVGAGRRTHLAAEG